MTLTHTPELCKVFYDRSAREYIVRNGHEIARFPSGPANKTLAQWKALEHDDANIASIARQLVADGSDEARTIRAARLVIEGKITLDRAELGYTRAIAQASAGNVSPVTGLPSYIVIQNLKWHCLCWDYERARDENPHHECKHILATKILVTQRREFDAAASRKQQDKLERRSLASEAPAQKPWYLRPDPINTSAAGAGRAQFVAHNYGR